MKYVRKTSKDIKSNFLNELLLDRGVIQNDEIFMQKFFNPTKENELPAENLDNIEEGYQTFINHIKNGDNFLLIVDPDADGYTSAALFYNYLKDNYNQYNYTIDVHTPYEKEHGLDTVIKEDIDFSKYQLIVCPDSATNDVDEHEFLKERGCDILCLDHHVKEKDSEYAIVINNQPSKRYSNKMLSGVGVVYKFFEYCEKKEGREAASQNYLDLVALGQISDMMEMSTLENRWICDYGLRHINNDFFQALLDKQSFSIGNGPLTQISIAFYIAPLINSLIRVGNDIEKERLFWAFTEPQKKVASTKKGDKNATETVCEQMVRACTNAKSRQNRFKDKAVDLLDMQIMNDCLEDDKILILSGEELDVPNTMTGLCAMGVAAKYKKPVLLGKETSDGYFKGSARGREDSELKDFRQFLIDSNLMDYAQGHPGAFGYSIKMSDIERLRKYCNKKLKNVNFNEGYYDVDFIKMANSADISKIIFDMERGKKLFGQGNKEPLIAIENIHIKESNCSIIGKNADTIRFEYNGITYIKFKAQDLIEGLQNLKNKDLTITVIGRGNVNEWGGKKTPQIMIDEIDICLSSIYDF